MDELLFSGLEGDVAEDIHRSGRYLFVVAIPRFGHTASQYHYYFSSKIIHLAQVRKGMDVSASSKRQCLHSSLMFAPYIFELHLLSNQ